jgi:SAM-dependent methyltransferase
MTGIYGKGFAGVYDQYWREFTDRAWPALIQLIGRPLSSQLQWLDLACGCGTLLRRVTARGVSGWGLDQSRHQLRYARHNAPQAHLLCGDLRTFNIGRAFDVITCLYDSLNYLTRAADLERVFRTVRQHLKPDGCLIFDMNTATGLEKRWHGTDVIRRPGCLLIVEKSYASARRRGCFHITGFRQRGRLYRRFEENHVERGYTPTEINAALARSGLRAHRFEGYKLKRATVNSPRLVYVCTRG